jgi:hypothetical protein
MPDLARQARAVIRLAAVGDQHVRGVQPEPGGAGDLGYDLEVFVTTVSDAGFGKTVTVTPPDPWNPPAPGTEINF